MREFRSMPQRGVQSVSLRRFCFMAACVGLLVAGAPLVVTESLARGPELRRRRCRRLAGCRRQHLHHSDAQGLGREHAQRPRPKGLAVRRVLRRFLRRRGQGRPAAQSELARLGLRHRPVRPGSHQQSRDRGRRRDHHQLHRRQQAEGGEDPRPRSQDRPRALESGAEEAAQGHHLRRLLQRCASAIG